MSQTWNQQRLDQLIKDQVEESLTLDYKAADALQRTDGKKREITKDVSAMANSAGGTIIYGIQESAANKHLPGKLDPILRTAFSKESLDQVIQNIQPKIDGLVIHPVALNASAEEVAYVVEIPQSHTAHQANDFRYYRRFNFESVPMQDYEIRDVMGRGQHPRIDLFFRVHLENRFPLFSYGRKQKTEHFYLYAFARNEGNAYAQYVNGYFYVVPSLIVPDTRKNLRHVDFEGKTRCGIFVDNTHRDVVEVKDGFPKHGPSRFDPILPELSKRVGDTELELVPDWQQAMGDQEISWIVYADNAPSRTGRVLFSALQLLDLRNEE